jgi:prepilin-type N-terminal cleavage/methylation domain-containing protein
LVLRKRAGFSLAELMLVMVIMTLLTLMSLPKFGALRERSKINSAMQRLESSIAAARAAAIQKGRNAQVIISNNSVLVKVTTNAAGATATVIPAVNFYTEYGVTFSYGTPTDSLLTYNARGFMSPTLTYAVKIRLQSTTRSDSICTTVAGQLMKRGCTM